MNDNILNKSIIFLLPDELELKTEYLVKYGNEFLKLNNLKIGDIIDFEFPYEKLHQKYKSHEMDKHIYKKIVKGVLKKDENGKLFIESIDDLIFYEHTSNGKIGKNRKTWYKQVNRKSIVKFGTGFIF